MQAYDFETVIKFSFRTHCHTELILSSAAEVAISPDEYVLLHKGSFKYLSVTLEASGYGGNCVCALPLETRLKNLRSLHS